MSYYKEWMKKTPKHIRNGDIKKLLAQCNTRYPTGRRDRSLIIFMLETGLRVSETCNLKRSDVDMTDDIVNIYDGKGHKDGVADLTPTAKQALIDWYAVAPESEYVFSTLKGGYLNRMAVGQMMSRRSKKAGIKHVTPHMLRHSFAIRMLEVEGDQLAVKEALRHTTLRMTEKYARATPKAVRRSTRNMEPIC